MIEQIVSLENQHMSGSGFYFFRTHAGAEIDPPHRSWPSADRLRPRTREAQATLAKLPS